MGQPREAKDVFDDGNPVTAVRHLTQHSTNRCLGLMVLVWCPGCQSLHTPRFRCPEHGGPATGPVWDGDPYSSPFTMSPSLLVGQTSVSPRCHSYIRNGRWEFLKDCGHALAGQTLPLEPLPNWLMDYFPED
jgi:hypothetical protein